MTPQDLGKAFAPIPLPFHRAVMSTVYGLEERPLARARVWIAIVMLAFALLAGMAAALFKNAIKGSSPFGNSGYNAYPTHYRAPGPT